jgi:hypothetical protein
MFSVHHRVAPGSSGHDWYLQLGIKFIEGHDSRTTLLMGLTAFMEIVPAFIDGFQLLPLISPSILPPLTTGSNIPKTAALAFKYFKVKNMSNMRGATAPPAVSHISPARHNDDEEFRPPTMLWGVVRVRGNENVKEAIDAVAWDMNDTGLSIRWKEHQSAESNAQVLLMCCPPIFDRQGVEEEIVFHLSQIEKDLIRKGKLPSDLSGVVLPKIKVSWRQNKQGKGKNKAEQGLSMNDLEAFQHNGCVVCTVKAEEG